MSNFRLWLESTSLTPTLRIDLEPYTAEQLYIMCVDYPLGGEDPHDTDYWQRGEDPVGNGPERIKYALWINSHLRQDPPSLTLPINLETLPLIHHLVEDIRWWFEDGARNLGREGNISLGGGEQLRDVLYQIEKPYVKIATLHNIAEKAPPQWKDALLDAITHSDTNKWLVYADYIEEAGQRRYAAIIRKMLTT